MAVFVKPETVEAARSSPARLHWVPCHIGHSGKANVSKYFETSVRDNGENGLTSSLRGRPLNGQKVQLPPGYIGLVLREGRRPIIEDEDRTLSATHSFTEFHHWNLDKLPSSEDSSSQVLQFINIAKAIHRPVDEESSQKSVTGK